MKSVYIIVNEAHAYTKVFTNLKALYNEIIQLRNTNGQFISVLVSVNAFGVGDYKQVRLTYENLTKYMKESQKGGKRYGFLEVYNAYDEPILEISEASIISK